MENNRHREALLASAASLSPFAPSDGTGPFVETKFTASKLKTNASRSAGGAAGGAGGDPSVAVITEPKLFIIPGTRKGSKFLEKGLNGFPPESQFLPGYHFGVFLADATKGTKGSYRELKETYIDNCDFALFYKNSDKILGFATIKLMEGKELEVTLLISILKKEGFGIDLLKAVNDIAKAAGYTRIVIKSTPEAQAFYKKSGYKNFGVENSLVLMNKSVTRRRRANRRKGTRRQRK